MASRHGSAPGLILDSPGQIIGTTYYDFQSNGSTRHRIAVDALGGVHFCWMKAVGPSLDPRYAYYGFISENGDSLAPIAVDLSDGGGFSQVGLLHGAGNPRLANAAVLTYHNVVRTDDRIAIDSGRGTGVFGIDSAGFQAMPDDYMWPNISVDINDNIQAIATQSDVAPGQPRLQAYSRRPYHSSVWTTPVVFDTTYCISPVVTSSPVSPRSAVVWTSPTHQDSNQCDNDVVFVESPDGLTWDFLNARVDITDYPPVAQGDTTQRAYADIDAVYDYDGNLHIIWNAPHVTRDSSGQMVVLYHTSLYHWSAVTGINLIYDHPVREWPADMGAWNLPVSKMSIGVDADSNFLYVVFTRFDPYDYAYLDTINGDPNPCGGDNAMPCANGELYLTWSTDGGTSWHAPSNITNSPSPNCLAGDCDNDNWSSLAERVDDYLHILYIDDKDAGGAALSEGDPTENPVIYLRIPNPTRSPGGDCQYLVGDVNGSGATNGLDVTYGVNFLKGGNPPPYECDCPGHGVFYVAGDVNGNCAFNGIDITYLVNYFKGGSILVSCPDCPGSLR